MPEGQLLQHVDVGRVAGLGALERRQLQLLEEHGGELLRRVRVDRLAGELVDLPEERVELRVELLRQLPEPLRVDPDPDPLHVGEHGDERHLERRVEALERRARRGAAAWDSREPPDALGPGAGPRRELRRVRVVRRRCRRGASRARSGTAGRRPLGRQLVERVPAPARVQEIRGHRRVVDAPRAQGDLRAARPADERLRVVPHERHVGGKLRPARVVGRAGGRARTPPRRGGPGPARSRQDRLDGEAPARAERGTRATPPGRRPARSRQAGPRRAPGPGASSVGELELGPERAEPLPLGLPDPEALQVELDGERPLEHRQLTREERLVAVARQRLAQLRAGDHREVRVERLEAAELPQELLGGDLPDPRHAGDVVDRVAHQREDVGDALGRDAPVLLDLLRRRRRRARRCGRGPRAP